MRVAAPEGSPPVAGRRLSRLASIAAMTAVAAALAGCGQRANDNPTSDAAAPNLFPGEVVTIQGVQSAGLYIYIFLIAVAIFVLVEGLLLYMTWRYRRRGGTGRSRRGVIHTAATPATGGAMAAGGPGPAAPADPLPVQTHGNDRLEIIWTAIPALIVTGMFIASMGVLASVEQKSDEPGEVVDVTAFQFQWTFAYPEHGLSYTGAGRDGPEMVLPVGEPVRIRLESADVIHSFYVPMFFFKRDVVPGQINEFEVTIEQPGTYGGQCAEFCGLAHADMFFSVRALERGEYDAWVAAELEAATPSPTPAVTPDGSPAPGSPGPGSPAPGSPAPASPGAGVTLEVASFQEAPLSFDTTLLEAPAGQQVTVEYLNDTSQPHNIAFFDGPDASAPRIAATAIVTGPGALEAVTFEAPEEPGSYYFHCDVHPIQMAGTFEVLP